MLTRKFYSTLLLFAFLLGCNNIDSAPELRDPIYQDLKSEGEKLDKNVEAKEKELEGITEQQPSLADNDYQKKLNRDEIFRLGNEISKMKQKVEFYSVSTESRQIFARKQYLEYFKQGKDWPPVGVKEKYFEIKEAESAPKKWNRGVASKPVEKEAKKTGEHDGGGE